MCGVNLLCMGIFCVYGSMIEKWSCLVYICDTCDGDTCFRCIWIRRICMSMYEVYFMLCVYEGICKGECIECEYGWLMNSEMCECDLCD